MPLGNKIEVLITGDTSKLTKALDDAGVKTNKFGKTMRTAGLAAAGALTGLGIAAKVGFDEFKQAEQVTAQTENALKKFGRTGQYTVKSIDAMSSSMMRKTGIDDEQIQSMTNVLLANENFRRGIGQTQAGLERATTAAMDWSARTGKDGVSAMTLLNKGLADPIKGLSLLGRAGIKFSDSQKETIKSMVKGGNIAGAQAIILGKLEGAFGGAAKAAGGTMVGKMNIAKETFRNTAAEVLTGLMPAMTGFASILSSVSGFMTRHSTTTKILVGAFAALAAGVIAVNLGMKLHAAYTAAASAAKAIFMTTTVVGTTAIDRQTVSVWRLNAAFLANPIVLVVAGLAALGVAFYIAWKKSETFRNIVKGALDAVKTAALAVAGFFTDTLPDAFQDVLDWTSSHWPEIATLLAGPFAPLVALATDAFGVKSALMDAFDWLKTNIGGAAKKVMNAAKDGFVAVAWDFPKFLFDRIIQPMIDKVTTVLEKAKDISKAVPQGIKDVVWGLADVFWTRIVTPLGNLIDNVGAVGKSLARAISQGIVDGMDGAKDWVVGKFAWFLNQIIKIFNKIPFVPNIDPIKLARGAIIGGPTMALVGEDGPEAVIPLGRKRRKRGQELLSAAAKSMGMSGDYPGPRVDPNRRGYVPALAEGGFVVPGAATGLVGLQIAAMKAAQTPNGFQAIADFAAKGLAKVVDTLPNAPDFPGDKLGMVSKIANSVKEHAVAALRELFARKDEWSAGRIIDGYNWAMSQMGKPYVWGGGHGGWNYNLGGYDCSGFASHAAKKAGSTIGSPGTTMSLYPASHPAGNAKFFLWGFRGMGNSDPARQHMGAKILGTWFQFGDPGRSGGSDSQWDSLRSVPGLPGYQRGTGFVSSTGPAMLHRGEAVIPAGNRGAIGSHLHFHFPQYLGSKEEVTEVIRTELIKLGRRVPGGAFGGLA